MKTITLQHEEKITRNIEINVPCYRKFSTFAFYMVLSEKKMIGIYDGSAVQKHDYISSAFNEGTSECTQEEFERAYERTTNMLDEIVFPPTPDEKELVDEDKPKDFQLSIKEALERHHDKIG